MVHTPSGRGGRGNGGREFGAAGGSGGLKAVVLIVVAVAVGVAVLSRVGSGHTTGSSTGSHSATTTVVTTTTVPASTTTTTTVPASQVKVQVLNGVGYGSLAGEWSEKLKSDFGYVTEPADNATKTVSSSEIYILTSGYLAEAEALAKNVGISDSAIDQTIPPPTSAPIPSSERSTANLVLVIGPDLESKA